LQLLQKSSLKIAVRVQLLDQNLSNRMRFACHSL